MRHAQHKAIARWERRWLAVSGLMSLTFVILIAISLALEGTHIAQRVGRTTPDLLTSHALFASPRVTSLGSNRFQVAQVAQTYVFTPNEIVLPVGAEVEFYLTSRDVIHGYQIRNTTINAEVIPGEVSWMRYTFDRPGEFDIICNQYCGISHQNMIGKIVVLPAAQYAQEHAGRVVTAEGPDALGQTAYNANCASCHQADGAGLAGVFPPLIGHTVTLFETDRDYLINMVLYGLQGPIEVNGANYNGVMPAWAQLSDEQIAAILNYTLTSWGNEDLVGDFIPYEAEEVAALRGQGLSAADILALRQSLGLR